MELIITSKHELLGDGYFIGVDSENNSEQLIIDIQHDALLNKWAFIEFQVNDEEKYTTHKLDIVDNKITYDIPNGLLKKGYVKVQVVFRDADNYVWKSFTRKFVVSDSILACNNLPKEYPDFIGEAQKLLEDIEIQADKVDAVLSTEEARKQAETDRQAAETTRISNENTRVSSETTRKAAETERIANENTRKANEAGRVSAEETRQTTFNGWKENLGNLNTYDKRLINLEEAGVGTIFDYQTDSTTAYLKDVPSKACSYALLNKVGGMTYKQDETLVDTKVTSLKVVGKNLINMAEAVKDEVFVYNGETTYTLTKTTDVRFSNIVPVNILAGQNIVFSFEILENTCVVVGNHIIQAKFFYTDGTTATFPLISGERRTALNNITGIQLYIDTKEEVGAYVKFKNFQLEYGTTATAYEPYMINNYTIPSGIQVLDGYGFGINDTCYNYIDFDRKVFVQRVKELVVTNEIINVCPLNESQTQIDYFMVTKPTDYRGYGNYQDGQILSEKYNFRINAESWDNSNNIGGIFGNGNTSYFFVGFEKGTTLSQAKEVLNGQVIVYELATPVETDISAYMEDNYIKVYPNGSMVFENEHSLAAPSEITYVVRK